MRQNRHRFGSGAAGTFRQNCLWVSRPDGRNIRFRVSEARAEPPKNTNKSCKSNAPH